mgnify:CR=1 FL=1
MDKKYRVNDLAKDLNVSTNDITEVVQEYFGVQKKSQASLSEEELSVVLEKYSQGNQVNNFNSYFASASKPKTEKKEEKPVKKVEKKSEPKKEAAKADDKTVKTEKAEAAQAKPAEVKAEPKAEAKAEVKAEAKSEIKAEPKAETKPEAKNDKPADRKPANDRNDRKPYGDRNNNRSDNRSDRPQGDRKPYGDRNGDRSGNRNDRQFGDRKPYGDRNNDRSDRQFGDRNNDRRNDNRNGYQGRNDRRDSKPAQQTAPAQPVIDLANIKTNAPPTKHVKGEAVQRGEQVTKHVDTRGSYVNLDKYNEKYETIASTEGGNRRQNDAYTKKQKISQKSQKGKQQFSKKKETEAQKLKRLELEKARKKQLEIQVPDEIVVSELASRLKVTAADVIKKLFSLGVMVTINQSVDYDTACIVAEEFGAKVTKEVVVSIEERLFEEVEDTDENLQPRSPVVVVMGHVDHGKTSLLDRIRNANVTAGEAGGITQHIGAYRVKAGGRDITFLDTPGHEAFTAMRARGALATDIAILVVAADDGIMPQTVEAINHAKAAGVEIIVAINKIDKPSANIERVKQELSEYELIPEDWGGSTIFCPVSAHTKEGIDNLLEMILLTAEVLELKANPNRKARGLVIEAQLDKGRGAVATVLVQKGTLRVGDPIACGSCFGKVRAMIDDQGRRVKEAGPSTPVEILGLSAVPEAGETFVSTDSEKEARAFADTYISESKNKLIEDTKAKMSLDDLFSQIQSGNVKELNIIVKADVQGSVEAVKQSLVKLSNEEVVVKVIHGGVGAINESDIILASASNAIIIGFNVRPDPTAKVTADRENVDVRLYKVIYNAIEDVEAAMKGMLDPVYEEKVLGHAEVRQIFKASGVGNIAGSYVLDGVFQRGCKVRISREGTQIFEGNLASLKRFKDDVKEVKAGYECGLVFEGFNDIAELDIVEAYTMVEVPR